mgnify:CR=1 FL=1
MHRQLRREARQLLVSLVSVTRNVSSAQTSKKYVAGGVAAGIVTTVVAGEDTLGRASPATVR